MVQDGLIIAALSAIVIFLIASVMVLNSYWKKHNSLSEKKDEKFIMFCEILEDGIESSLFGKQSNESNGMEKKYNTISK